jgi:hypothetical protein
MVGSEGFLDDFLHGRLKGQLGQSATFEIGDEMLTTQGGGFQRHLRSDGSCDFSEVIVLCQRRTRPKA